MKKALVLLAAIFVFVPSTVFAQIVPPRPGVEMPQAYFDRVAQDKTAFQFQNAWIQKAQRAKEARERFLATPRPQGLSFASLPESVKKSMMVSGTAYAPVLTGKYANTGADPYPVSQLQSKLFDPPPALSMTHLYHEMSYGNLTLTGTVYDWVDLPQNDTYYEGPAGCYGLCGSANTGKFILALLQANDPTVDFGLYDNDGPDGVPNSGDDDGLVDFVAFVHPEIGAECGGNNNLWSHRWVITGWPEFSSPWVTNDPRAGGGFISVYDYTIQPAVGSENGCGSGVIEIGVFCHEFGHAFGLPDFYDTDGGSHGIGHWGLMGSGNWNDPPNPAHMTAYSKAELGWIVPTEVGPTTQPYTINSSEVTPQAYKVNVMEEKFSRKGISPIGGSYSMHCGLTAAEAGLRNWASGAGYGNGWDEAVRREFSYNGGDHPVTLEYDYQHHTEAGFDYGHVKIDVNGTVSTLASYDGIGSGNASIDLTPYLDGSGASSYELIFQFESDYALSDEDGIEGFNSGSMGPFKFDNVSVTGGGESYSTGFEMYEDGWHYDRSKNPAKEYFLVENRNKTGAQFDQFLYAPGLVIYHVEQDVARTILANSGNGNPGSTTRGVMLEEADGLEHLLYGSNRGDGGDVYPGSTNNTTFNNSTTPNSMSHNGYVTRALVENISVGGTVMTADMRGGYFPPTVSSIKPRFWYTDSLVTITNLEGTSFLHGATFLLRDAGMNEYAATTAEWIGKTMLTGVLDLTGMASGNYDVLVRNPDGQEAVLEHGFQVRNIVPVFVQMFDARATWNGVELAWDILADEPVSGFKIARRETGESSEKEIQGAELIGPEVRAFTDDTVRPGTKYEYVLVVVLGNGAEQRSRTISVKSATYALTLMQNHPNPFNPTTRIGFTLPERTHVTLVVYDPAGKQVTTLVNETRNAGANDVTWDGRNAAGDPVSSGVYFYRLRVGKQVLTRKMLLLR
ncbi:MAG: M6 family metalloprotease domain-containing protein [Candidatus Latescibacterota bacterium]|nr:MAG: M6 family metalloprotease domain-containing protein [Candidatus Latescibacterota bacterium]